MSIEGATPEGAMLHTAFMLTVRGTPQLYTGEEIAMEGKDDPDNRRDFPGGFPGDSRSAFLAAQRTPPEQRMWQWTHDWIRLRREHSALRGGRLVDLSYDDDVYVYARQDSKETVIIVINRSSGEKRISFPAATIGVRDGSHLASLYGGGTRVVITNQDAVLTVAAKMASAYVVR